MIQDTVSIIGCGESGGYDQGGEIPPIPEPTTMILLGSGLVGAAMRMRRRIGSGRP
ncbi:MAG: PEP-CTERM sorting domain-containing protein [Acidobacteria bacterium]|nr:PEP-CTERM sorting domain-containing protein [Acidobacteriota bacterium]